MVAAYNQRDTLAAIPPLQAEKIKELHRYGLLSARALAATVGAKESTVLKVIGRSAGRQRGALNPEHIGWLAYALSLKKITPDNLRRMLSNGTSISTIEDLTGISRSNLNRWRQQ
jgi:hypothetical protein